MVEEKKEKQVSFGDVLKENDEEQIYSTEEIEIEEMAIDGICGVY